MPMLFSDDRRRDTAKHWHLWGRCPASRTTSSTDLRDVELHPNATVTSLGRRAGQPVLAAPEKAKW